MQDTKLIEPHIKRVIRCHRATNMSDPLLQGTEEISQTVHSSDSL